MYSAHLLVKTPDVKLEGPAPREHTVKGVDGSDVRVEHCSRLRCKMRREWCDECGCGLFIKPSTKPDMTGVKAGLFDPKDVPAPTHEVFLQDMCVHPIVSSS